MRRFQMMIDEELDDALEWRAARDPIPKAELLRRLARERLLPQLVSADDPIWALCGISEGPDLVEDSYAGRVSEHVSDVLYGPASPSAAAR